MSLVVLLGLADADGDPQPMYLHFHKLLVEIGRLQIDARTWPTRERPSARRFDAGPRPLSLQR
jgi:hypothetical protein